MPFIVLGFTVNPEFVCGDVGISIVLAKVGKLFIFMAAYIATIDDPNL